MTMQDVAKGAGSGLLTAMVVDINAWYRGKDPLTGSKPQWDFKLMLGRWAAGAAIGALTVISPAIATSAPLTSS